MPAFKTRPLRVFIVENHADTLKWITLFLEDFGHTVLSARSMSAALAALPSANCNVLISDIGLPDGDGWELLRQAHLPHTVYAIAMSGFGLNADRTRSKAAGYRQHLLKPFKAGELEGAMDAAAAEMAA